MLKKRFIPFAPSTDAASYSVDGICFKADKKISIEDPNCQTASIINVHMAVLLFPSQAKLVSIPIIPKR